ncbi:uncharacterized protein LOC123548702 [Mercenaria mercenaria]|uniref:uncharacterized protein LOC123548702 n=1 Tax=Mercenaria mercenaria TaxID=6596 RepID=UPI001E1D22B2|nr:uncharacterized protein LOC123548702 [Mercenaria mercenaria]XP_045192129.1 uncharacterized protein LOC123548702 [Mercenaria mercenaria]XP_045192130.1 uncharacterized protein LOC123548702 [Mercenaria mercenaria]XP_045192132.1 uncharacterized protein LOC123548702 [Mercenaria mercenaria]XP_045192133.1 uncharacterized protein LOC123548702 [Mercenaria mercenaria]
MEAEPLDLCYSQPNLYRLCDKRICIPWDKKCPCKTETEFRCSLGNCIPLELKCDGLKQCLYGEDEDQCLVGIITEATDTRSVALTEGLRIVNSAAEEGLPIPVVVTIVSVGVFVGVLLAILLYFYITRRKKNNTSRESQSATEPLRKSYITAAVETPDVSTKFKETSKEKTYISRKPERTHYLPVDIECEDSDFQINNQDEIYEREHLETDDSENSHNKCDCENGHNKCRKNLAINPGVEIYDVDPSDEYRVSGLGKYTFKPRLKYMKSKPYHEIDEKDRDKLYVINSYKHCSGKSILPSTLTFDKDPEKFSNKFATDLLCSSTPRQLAKHSVKNVVSGSLESITSDIEIT